MQKMRLFTLFSLLSALGTAIVVPTSAAPNAAIPTVTTAGPYAGPQLTAKTKILVTPFEYVGAANSLSGFSLSVPAHVAERLEDDTQLEPVNGELVLTAAQARLVSATGKHFDLAAANRLARAKGARFFLTGRFSGQTWTWKTEVFLYESGVSEPTLIGSGAVTGSLDTEIEFEDWKGSKRLVNGRSADRLFGFTGEAMAQAFAAANVPLSDASIAAVGARPTKSSDAYASLLLGRAYQRYFNAATETPAKQTAKPAAGRKPTAKAKREAESGAKGTPLGWAKEAAVNDPKHAEAKRFYAMLLEQNGSPKLARFQYEFAVEARPSDYRSLVRLGRLEMTMHNEEIAEGYLKRATEARPQDGDPFYWYGMAQLHSGKTDAAIASLERARTLQPLHGAARRELALQYSWRKRYADAAAEFAVVAKDIEPNNSEPVFLQAACLRAAGLGEQAMQVLNEAVPRFPAESRMLKFRGDLLTAAGDVEGARAEYAAALRIAPNDARLKAVLGGAATDVPLGGQTLLAATSGAVADAIAAETLRSQSQRAMNVAVTDMYDNGSKACVDGRAPSFAQLGIRLQQEHQKVVLGLQSASTGIERAFRDGEAAAYTPDEAASARKVIADTRVSVRDVRELEGQRVHTLVPLFREKRCDEFDGPVAEATMEQVSARTFDRRVTMPPYKLPPASMTFTPQVDPREAKRIRFTVNNLEGDVPKEVTVDGALLGTVPAGEKSDDFEVSVGYHQLCVLPAGAKCGDATTLRLPFLHQGWTITSHTAKQR